MSPAPIAGVSLDLTAFVGFAPQGPALLEAGDAATATLRSLAEFEQVFGSAGQLRIGGQPAPNYLALAARAFFGNGGRRLVVARILDTGDYQAALDRLAAFGEIGLVAAPGASALSGGMPGVVARMLIAHADAPRVRRFAVVDPPSGLDPGAVRAFRDGLAGTSAALFYPWIQVSNPSGGAPLAIPPSGAVCGIIARTDEQFGVWKSPGGQGVKGAIGLERAIGQAEQDLLNPHGIDCIRMFDARGILLWGARTLSTEAEWRYVNVRRSLAYLERSLGEGLQWVVFEPNDEPLWACVREAVLRFLEREWRTGALQGRRLDEACFVRCDRTTMSQDDIDNGRLICMVGFAPVRPAEFVVFRIGLMTARSDA